MSNQQIAVLLSVVGVVGGLAAQARSQMLWIVLDWLIWPLVVGEGRPSY